MSKGKKTCRKCKKKDYTSNMKANKTKQCYWCKDCFAKREINTDRHNYKTKKTYVSPNSMWDFVRLPLENEKWQKKK